MKDNAEFVTLSCPSCGGKLQITNDIERFVCVHCGNEHIVKRGGGIIAITPVIEGIKKVQIGTDKTASELAIRRLKEELEVLWLEARKLTVVVTGRGEKPQGFFKDLKRGFNQDLKLPLINDYLYEKGIINKKQRKNPLFLLSWNNYELLFSLSIVDFENLERRAQELISKSKGGRRNAYEEIIEWCKQVGAVLKVIRDKSSELKSHQESVRA